MIACNHFMSYMGPMSSITVRNIPESVKAALARRAEETGESLEAFLRRILQAEATTVSAKPNWKEFVAGIRTRVESLPPLEPGDIDAWEHSEEFARRDTPLEAP